jgi:hypothetical protein
MRGARVIRFLGEGTERRFASTLMLEACFCRPKEAIASRISVAEKV